MRKILLKKGFYWKPNVINRSEEYQAKQIHGMQ
jgi:hypothetical protein